MKKVKLTIEDIDNCTDEFLEALDIMNLEDIKDITYRENLKVNDIVEITKFYDYNNYEISIKLNKEQQYLLSFMTDLDAEWYDCSSTLYNDIVLNENDRVYANMGSFETERIEFMLMDIERELEELTDISTNPQIDIYGYIKHFCSDFENKINVDLLIEKIEDGINKLLNLINRQIMNYLENEFLELISECEYYNIQHLRCEALEKGYVEVYI